MNKKKKSKSKCSHRWRLVNALAWGTPEQSPCSCYQVKHSHTADWVTHRQLPGGDLCSFHWQSEKLKGRTPRLFHETYSRMAWLACDGPFPPFQGTSQKAVIISLEVTEESSQWLFLLGLCPWKCLHSEHPSISRWWRRKWWDFIKLL